MPESNAVSRLKVMEVQLGAMCVILWHFPRYLSYLMSLFVVQGAAQRFCPYRYVMLQVRGQGTEGERRNRLEMSAKLRCMPAMANPSLPGALLGWRSEMTRARSSKFRPPAAALTCTGGELGFLRASASQERSLGTSWTEILLPSYKSTRRIPWTARSPMAVTCPGSCLKVR